MTERGPSINVNLPADLLKRLNAVCEANLIGRRLVIQRAIESVVADLERRPQRWWRAEDPEEIS